MSTQPVMCVVGNPNCGKTTLFNVLTGGKQTVGNWPGVTVEKKVGSYRYQQQQVTLVDLPGVYSLNPSSESSEDERVARDYILSGEANLVLNIVDASNLERNLYLTAQLLDMQVPMVVAVNMMDIAAARKLDIDIAGLQQRLGCPVIPITASQKKGIAMLHEVCQAALAQPVIPPVSIPYDAPLNQAAQAIADKLQGQAAIRNPYWLAIQLLEGDMTVRDRVPADTLAFADAEVARLVAEYEDELDIFLADARYQFVGAVAREVITRRGEASATLTDKIDRVVLHRFFGIPIFLLVMYLMFVFTINIGSAFIDFFRQAVRHLAGGWIRRAVAGVAYPGMAENPAGGWRGRRYSDRIHLYSGDRLSVSVPVLVGGFRLYGASGVCDGPLYAQHRFAGQGVRAADCRVWL
ncbi:hypothetical protein OS31_46310 [Dickeya oryzae]